MSVSWAQARLVVKDGKKIVSMPGGVFENAENLRPLEKGLTV